MHLYHTFHHMTSLIHLLNFFPAWLEPPFKKCLRFHLVPSFCSQGEGPDQLKMPFRTLTSWSLFHVYFKVNASVCLCFF